MDIDTMPAGRELDALVAERVMGWTREECIIDGQSLGLWFRKPGTTGERGLFSRCPHYSTDIKDAWQTMERLSLNWANVELEIHPKEPLANRYLCYVSDNQSVGFLAVSHTPELAMCHAALKAMEATSD